MEALSFLPMELQTSRCVIELEKRLSSGLSEQLLGASAESRCVPFVAGHGCAPSRVLLYLQVAGVYGNTYTLWLGQTPVIVLNGFQAVKDALIDHAAEFAERPISPFFRDLVGGPHGTFWLCWCVCVCVCEETCPWEHLSLVAPLHAVLPPFRDVYATDPREGHVLLKFWPFHVHSVHGTDVRRLGSPHGLCPPSAKSKQPSRQTVRVSVY